MKIQKLLAILIIFLSFTPHVLAMENTKKSITYDKKRINKLISKKNISPTKQVELATLCLSYPLECEDKNIFQKIDPNLVINNNYFVMELLSKKEGCRELLKEALKQNTWDPHLRKGSESNDLALEILKIYDQELIDDLINHAKFNPNARYGKSRYPLATMLFLAKNIESLFIVMRHKNFSSKVSDKDNIRPGYHMLANISVGYSEACFLAFMGQDLAAWNMRGLGLNIKEHLDYVLRILLQNNADRLVIFKKIVEQVLLPQEDITYKSFFDSINKLFSLDKPLGSFVYIDEEFTCKAVRIMTNYCVIGESNKDGVLKYPCWSILCTKSLDDITIKSFKTARVRHLVENDNNTCALCLKETTEPWFKTSLWCDHAFCVDCLLAHVSSLKDGEELKCPSQGCIFPSPPSLLLALTTVHLNSVDEFEMLEKTYAKCWQLQEKITEETMKALPGLVRCPSCGTPMVGNIKKTDKRSVNCLSCKKNFIIVVPRLDRGIH